MGTDGVVYPDESPRHSEDERKGRFGEGLRWWEIVFVYVLVGVYSVVLGWLAWVAGGLLVAGFS